MRPDYAEADFVVGPSVPNKPKEGTGWTTAWSEPGGLPVLVPGGPETIVPVMIERTTSRQGSAKPVARASDAGVVVTFVPTTVAVDARIGSRALVECRLTCGVLVVGSVKVSIWSEDA